MKHLIGFIFLAVLLPTCVWAESGDTLYLRRNANGKIAFAQFAVNESSDRKMRNDLAFLQSVLETGTEDEFHLKSETALSWT
jgi:hypothetical protein